MLLFLCADATCTYSTTTTTIHTYLCFNLSCRVHRSRYWKNSLRIRSRFFVAVSSGGGIWKQPWGICEKKVCLWYTLVVLGAVTSSTDNNLKIHARMTLDVWCILACSFSIFTVPGLKPITRTLQTNAVISISKDFTTPWDEWRERLWVVRALSFDGLPMLTSTFWNKDLWKVRSTLGVVHEHLWCIFRIFRIFRVGVVPCTWHLLFYTILLWQCRNNWTVEHPSSPPKNTTTRDG